jgi:hypothetical protein
VERNGRTEILKERNWELLDQGREEWEVGHFWKNLWINE